MKKTIFLLLILVMICTLVGCVSNNESEFSSELESNDEENIVEETTSSLHLTEIPEGYIGIYSVEDFEYIRTNSKYNYILMNDIDFTSVNEWEYIEILGTFDGNNYSINNYKQSNPLFNKCNGTIQNLNMKNAEVNGNAILCSELSSYYSDVEKYLYPGELINCSIEGTVNIVITQDNFKGAGGIVMYARSDAQDSENLPSINNYTFNGSINADYTYDEYFINNGGNCALGGIVGYCDRCNISECTSQGEITFNETNMENNFDNLKINIGGILGQAGVATLSNLKNEMNIASNSKSINAAGIVGLSSTYFNSTTVSECCNLGNITLSDSSEDVRAGGITANFKSYYPVIYNCYNVGNITAGDAGGLSCCKAVLKYSYNAGQVNGANKSGAISCYICENIEYCYYLNNGLDVTGEGGKYPYVKALSELDMENQTSFEGFDFDNVWTYSQGTYKYPVFI